MYYASNAGDIRSRLSFECSLPRARASGSLLSQIRATGEDEIRGIRYGATISAVHRLQG